MTRVAIPYPGFVPLYRLPFFELLAAASEIEYVVLHGDQPPGTYLPTADPPFAFPNVEIRNVSKDIKGKTAVYQCCVQHLMQSDYDAVILGTHLQHLSNPVIELGYRLKRRRFILWGHGFEKDRDMSRLGVAASNMGARYKNWVARRADGYLVYTQGGARHLVAAGVETGRVFVVRNTLDTRKEMQHAEGVAASETWEETRQALGLHDGSIRMLFVGRLYKEKRVGELLDLAAELRRRGVSDFEIVIVGDGPEREALTRKAHDASLPVRIVGEVWDPIELARWLRVARCVVVPGAVGLIVNQAFCHGVPVLTVASRLHGPEVEYIQNGENGFVTSGAPDLCDRVFEVLHDDEQHAHLVKGARRTSRNLSIDRMAESFDAGVRSVLGT